MKKPANFKKMNGLGNQIIVADMRGRQDNVTSQAALYLAHDSQTHFDQIMAVYDSFSPEYDFRMEIWNQDGTQAQSCGNGTRCVVEWLYQETGKDEFIFDTKAGKLIAKRMDHALVAVDMGKPKFNWQDIPLSMPVENTLHVPLIIGSLTEASVVSMGNPHAIFFVPNNVWTYPLDDYGPLLEHNALFPERCNISIAQIISDKHISIRTWERGAGLTQACGTAACATAVTAVRRGLTNRIMRLDVPGGSLNIEWRHDDHVIMVGPTEFEFSGQFDPFSGIFERDARQEKA